MIIALSYHFMPLLGCRAHEGSQRKERIIVPAQCCSVQSQGSSPPAPWLLLPWPRGTSRLWPSSPGPGPASCGTAAGVVGELRKCDGPPGTGVPLGAAGLTLSCRPWLGHAVSGSLMGLARASPSLVCLGCVHFGTLNHGGWHHCSGNPGAMRPGFVARSVSDALGDVGEHLPFSSGSVPGFAQTCEHASRALITYGNVA